MEKAVGFYWTLPVPWASFVDLPSDVEEASKYSRTIRYQMELIRRYAKMHSYDLIREEIFIEIAPDRGSALIQDSLDAIEKECHKLDAKVLVVDFSQVQNWRRHGYMNEWFNKTDLEVDRIYPDPLSTAEWTFDPQKHFSEWRRRQSEWMSSKSERKAVALARAKQLKSIDMSDSEVAATLNAEKISSPSGKLWSERNVRAFLKNNAGP